MTRANDIITEMVAGIGRLPKAEQDALGMVCINQGQYIAPEMARMLKARKLIVSDKVGGYDVASMAVHMAWCAWCSAQNEVENAD